MEPVDLRVAKARLETLRRRGREMLVGAVFLGGAGAVGAARGYSQLAFSGAFGAAVGGAMAYLPRAGRSPLLTPLLAPGGAAPGPEGGAFARELPGPAKRFVPAR